MYNRVYIEVMHVTSQYVEVTMDTMSGRKPTETQKTHLKWERAVVQLNVQIDSTKNQNYLFTDCRKQFVLHLVSQFALLTAAILPDVLLLSPAEGAGPGGKVTSAHTLCSI